MKKSTKLTFPLGALFLSSAFLTAPAWAETAGTLPAFLPKNYKLIGTVKGKYVLGWNRSKFLNEPEFPTLDFETGKDIYNTTSFNIQPNVTQEKWEDAHKAPFKYKAMGGGILHKRL